MEKDDTYDYSLGASVKDASEEAVNNNDPEAGTIESYVVERFKRADTARYTDEQRWLRAYRNFRGQYGPDTQFRDNEKSRVFIKITKTKSLAAYGQISDLLFGSNEFPIRIEPSKLPEGVEESVSLETDPNLQQVAQVTQEESQNTELLPGETLPEKILRLGGLKKKLAPVEGKLVKGAGQTPSSVTFHPAQVSAKKMQKKIHDQLDECNARKELRTFTLELVIFGTGIVKGPFAVDKEYPDWDEEGNYKPTKKTIPKMSAVSVWNFYPDPDANFMEDAEYVVERHKMSMSQMYSLNKRPNFRKNAISAAVHRGPNYIRDDWEQTMNDDKNSSHTERWEVLEFWGNVETEVLERNGIAIPPELSGDPQLSANIWVCNGILLRCVLNPFNPKHIPYYAVPYEVNPYSFFGVGLPENMEDTQTLMNGFMRLSVENAALSGNLIFEIDEDALVPGQNLNDISPGKVFRRQGGAPGQAIFGTQFPNVAAQNLQLFDKARQLSDESTGLPSFAHGQTGITGVGRTSSGISMLMSAANGGIRTVVNNIDDYLLTPLGKAFFHFNMQFDHDPEIKGDLEVHATGTQGLMADEVRSQRLMQFLGVIQNPTLAPFAKNDYIISEIARSLHLDPEKVVNSLSDAAIQAEIMKTLAPAGPQAEQAPTGDMPAGTSVTDPTGAGGGSIGVGQAPTPGEPGFTGTRGGQE